jgi:AraC-like DNA-binding protein
LWVTFAGHQIATTDDPLIRIALAARFADQPHFFRVFKPLTGLTPSAYRVVVRANPGQKFQPYKTQP